MKYILTGNPRPVDAIIGTLNKTVEELKSASSHHEEKAAEFAMKSEVHRCESSRAARIASKFTELLQ